MMVTETWVMKTDISDFVPKINGANTAIAVVVPVITANPTSRTPLRVDALGLRSLSDRSRKILSVMTTALSTNMPTASMSPIIDRMLSVRSKKYSAPRVISNENGTDAMTISVVDACRRNR